MPISVTEKINIQSSPSEISDYMFDPANDTTWIGGVVQVKNLTSDKLDIGSEIHRIANFLGKDIDYILMINRLEKGKYLGMESTKSPFPMKMNYIIEQGVPPGPNGEESYSVVKIRIEADAKGYLMFVDRLLTLMVSRNMRGDLRRLKSILEGREFDEEYID